jgi:hypothetical protein
MCSDVINHEVIYSFNTLLKDNVLCDTLFSEQHLSMQ